jgi:hypothetical protein
VSDAPQGPGWWQASDAKWYPPETHPGAWVREPEGPPSGSSFGVGQPGIPVPPVVGADDQHRGISRPIEWAIVIGGAILVAIGSVLPWASVAVPFNGQLDIAGTEGDGMFTLVLAFAVILLGVVGLNGRLGVGVSIAALVGSAAALITGLVDITHIARIGGDNLNLFGTEFAGPSVGVGLVLVLIGAAVSILGTVILLVRR